MTLINNYHDKLYTTDCNYKEPLIDGSRIIIPTQNLGIIPGHPLNSTKRTLFLSECRLIFEGVKSSKRELSDYTESSPGSKHFRPSDTPRIVSDGPFPETDSDKTFTLFAIEGVMEEPLAWVDWEIQSVSFLLDV